MKRLQLAAWHGWGFPRTCWSGWEERLPEEIRFTAADRGYFGPPSAPAIEDNLPLALLVHSWGLHLLPAELTEKADLLVIFSGFRTFHPSGPAGKRSRLLLRRMAARLEGDPEGVLRDFRRNTWHPLQPPEFTAGALNRERLLEDLVELGRRKLPMEMLGKGDKIRILHGTADGIVPPERGHDLHRQAGSGSRLHEVEGAPHALPFTHTGRCLEILQPEFQALINRKR